MLKWCSAAQAVTQHNLKMNVHPIRRLVAGCKVLAVGLPVCWVAGSRASERAPKPVMREMGLLTPTLFEKPVNI